MFPHSNTSSSQEAGTTLIEVVLALGVIAFAVLPLMGTIAMGHGSYRTASHLAAESIIVNEVRTLVGDVNEANPLVGPVHFSVEGVLIPPSDPGVIFRAQIAPAQATGVMGASWEVLANRYEVVHVPSEQVVARGVVHITPR